MCDLHDEREKKQLSHVTLLRHHPPTHLTDESYIQLTHTYRGPQASNQVRSFWYHEEERRRKGQAEKWGEHNINVRLQQHERGKWFSQG